jgi:hypothetical protein
LKLDNFGGLTIYSGSPSSAGEKRWQSKAEKYAEVAKKFRPVINFRDDHLCFPLTFTNSDASSEGYQNDCYSSFDSNFVVFSNVTDHPDDRPNSYRITYGVAFGWQSGTLGAPPGLPLSLPGVHGYDAQYLVVDVVDDRVLSVWADMHQGHYARAADNGVVMHTSNNVTAWAGKAYNSLKLLTDVTTVCSHHWIDGRIGIAPGLAALCASVCVVENTCGIYDTILNWGDYVGQDIHDQEGKLVMTDHACAASTGQSYVSADGVTYDSPKLEGLRNYIGCDGASYPWGDGGNTYRSKDEATDPYAITGCKSGDAANGGDICNATHFSTDTWKTSSSFKNLYIEPHTVGSADVDYSAGASNNFLGSIHAVPTRIGILTGNNVKRVEVAYDDNAYLALGGTGGDFQEIHGVKDDPVVEVELCSGAGDGYKRVGHVKFITQSGQVMQGGKHYDECHTIKPAGKRFYGFYGRAGDEIDVLGTIWGDL